MTKADFGRVNLTGNLCPVDVRAINADDYTQLLGKFPQVQQLLFQASEDRLKNEGDIASLKELVRQLIDISQRMM